MIIFLYGEDSFRSSQKLREIKDKFLAKDKAGSGLAIFDFGEIRKKEQKILDAFVSINLLTPKRLIIIKNFFSEAGDNEKEEGVEFFEKNGKDIEKDQDLIAVFWEGNLPKKSDKFLKLLLNISKSQNFEALQGAKLSQWAVKKIKERDPRSGITKEALEKLIAYSGGEMHLLDKEIEKLINYAAGRIIKEADVELLVKSNVDSNIFNIIDALGNNNKKQASALLHQHLSKGGDPFYIFSMFVYQFRNLLKVSDLQQNQGMGEYEIAKIAKMHPYVVKKSLGQIRNFSFDKLKQIYQKLGNLDTKAKTGGIDIKLALDKFLVEL